MATGQLLRNTMIGLVVSLLLALAKFIAGAVGHSSALIADGVESMADAVGSIIAFQGIRTSAEPPDLNHPYGYGKAEAIAALSVGGLMLVAAAIIVVKSFEQILTPHDAPAAWTLIVLLGVVVVKESLFRLLLRGAQAFDSSAAKADAWHQRSDAITSAAAFVGVSLAVWGPDLAHVPRLVLADEAAALIASGIIVRTALTLVGPSLQELLDAAPHGLVSRIKQVAEQVEGVRLVEKVHARKSGRGYFVDMHLHVDSHLNVLVAHALSGKVKSNVRAQVPAVIGVLIHVEPARTIEAPELAPQSTLSFRSRESLDE